MNGDPLDPDLREVFPFRQIMCAGSACADHAALDGFIAHRDDLVWRFINPPNGPSPCHCTVLNLMDSDVPADSPGRLPGRPRLDAKLLQRCARFGGRIA